MPRLVGGPDRQPARGHGGGSFAFDLAFVQLALTQLGGAHPARDRRVSEFSPQTQGMAEIDRGPAPPSAN